MAEINAYPLCWPEHRPRIRLRQMARFDTTFAKARDNVIHEIGLLTDQRKPDVIISTNIPVRLDGIPYANMREPQDPAVAVYFTYKGKQRCFACDRWSKVADNMQAACKTIEALRGIARWGTGDMLEAAFTGFTALPAPTVSGPLSWREVLGCHKGTTLDGAKAAYRRLASDNHPDKGGSDTKMAEINAAMSAAQKELG